jgi:hypothetical protein
MQGEPSSDSGMSERQADQDGSPCRLRIESEPAEDFFARPSQKSPAWTENSPENHRVARCLLTIPCGGALPLPMPVLYSQRRRRWRIVVVQEF